VPINDGRVLWLFGDSHVDDLDLATGTIPCLFQVRNAALLHAQKDLIRPRTILGSGSGVRSWLKHPTNDKVWFWPGCGFQVGHDVFIYLDGLRSTAEGGAWGFERTDQDWFARVPVTHLDQVNYIPLEGFDGISFGCGFVKRGRHTLAFGKRRDGTVANVYVARFLTRDPIQNWTFWDGHDWTTNPTRAAVVARGASTSVHVCEVKNKFLMTTSEFSVACDQGKSIYVSVSAGPTGPFSPLKRVFEIEDRCQGHTPFFYMAVAHPEFINKHRELLVTYSINCYEPCVPACISGRGIPDHYRPKAVRIPLALIDPEL
jgi:hypothetical protein